MASKTKSRKATSSSSSQPAKKTPREKGPSLHDRVIDVEARLAGVEDRLGIDHAAIAAGVAASNEAGAAAAALSEPATDEDEEA